MGKIAKGDGLTKVRESIAELCGDPALLLLGDADVLLIAEKERVTVDQMVGGRKVGDASVEALKLAIAGLGARDSGRSLIRPAADGGESEVVEPKKAKPNNDQPAASNVRERVIVDLDAAPFTPAGWTVVEHRKGGTLDLATAKIGLYIGDPSMCSFDLYKDLADKPVLNANVLDFLLRKENQHLIPEDWKGKEVFFWGTMYRSRDNFWFVRCLYWNGRAWGWHKNNWLSYNWYCGHPAAVASI